VASLATPSTAYGSISGGEDIVDNVCFQCPRLNGDKKKIKVREGKEAVEIWNVNNLLT
jgi:hypothetical protein